MVAPVLIWDGGNRLERPPLRTVVRVMKVRKLPLQRLDEIMMRVSLTIHVLA